MQKFPTLMLCYAIANHANCGHVQLITYMSDTTNRNDPALLNCGIIFVTSQAYAFTCEYTVYILAFHV